MPLEFKGCIRDRVPPWLKSPPPQCRILQWVEWDALAWEAIQRKLDKVQKLGSIRARPVKTSHLTLQYQKAKVTFACSMTGPRVDSMMLCGTLGPPAYHMKHLSCVGPKAYMGDIDIKDMMHPELCSVIGVDLIPYFPKELHPKMEVHHLREHWPHCGKGFKNSPLYCHPSCPLCQGYHTWRSKG